MEDPITKIGELARAVGAHRNTVARWVRAGVPRRPDGSFDLAAVERWVRARRSAAASRNRWGDAPDAGEAPPDEAPVEREAADDRDPAEAPAPQLGTARNGERREGKGPLSAEARAADRRWRIARADRMELALARERGEMIERAAVAEMLRDRAQAFRRSLEGMSRGLSRKIARLSEPNQVRQALADAFAELLRSTYERAPKPRPSPKRRRRKGVA